jgi:hypothetical protein
VVDETALKHVQLEDLVGDRLHVVVVLDGGVGVAARQRLGQQVLQPFGQGLENLVLDGLGAGEAQVHRVLL